MRQGGWNMKLNKIFITLLFVVSSFFVHNSEVQADQPETIEGWFFVLWGDSEDGMDSTERYYLNTDTESINLFFDEENRAEFQNLWTLNRKRVSLQGTWMLSDSEGVESAFQVDSISIIDVQSLDDTSALAVIGSQPWVSILCKFSDKSAEPKNLNFFLGMLDSSSPGLDHYWRQVSYNQVNLVGSTAIGWYNLPQPHSYYVNNGQLNHNRAAQDCTGVADPYINFANFVGINLMFNHELDGYAWGGGHYMTLDGVSKVWQVTWEPPWGYADITVIAHEMGHGFGLPHSSGKYGQTYDNRWDVMSDGWTDCSNSTHVTYGCLGQHTISYHKDLLGWIDPSQKYVHTGGTNTITLEQLALPQTSNYKMAQISIGGSSTRFYTVEVRRKTGYDVKLPGQAVIIHEVDTSRNIPAHVIDADGNGNTGDAGAMWVVGETFSDSANGISVSVLSSTSSGFQISITSPVLTTPGVFNKTSPSNGATGQPNTVTLQWSSSSGATSYEYCYDTSNDNACSNWVSNGSATSKTLSGLNPGTTYYWHVRAKNADGTTYANGSGTVFWSFATSASLPAAAASAWTSDGSWGPKTIFDAGNAIQWVIDVSNQTGGPAPVLLTFLATDPNGTVVAYWEGTVTAAAGTQSWALPGTVGNVSGTYTFTGAVTHQAVRTEKSATYTVPANVNVYTGGAHQAGYNLNSLDSLRVFYGGVNNGPLQVVRANGVNGLSSLRVLYKNSSYSEMLGLPASQLAKEHWFPIYESAGSLNSQLRVGNLENKSTTISVYIGNNQLLDTFGLGANEAIRKNYTGVNNGPLRVVSSASNILTSVRFLYGDSYTEELGMPASQLTNTYWFPWYNNVAFPSELRVANTGGGTAAVTVYIGDNEVLDTFNLGAGVSVRKSYAGKNDGPLRVTSTGSTVLPSIKVLYKDDSYSEMLGLPASKLTNEYWMPVYDSATANSQIRVGNMGGQSTTVSVYAGGQLLESFSLGVGDAARRNYTGVNKGPLRVVSSATNVMVSVRILYTGGSFESYYELMAYPGSQLTSTYWFPWYNNVAFPSELRIAVP